MIKYGKGLARKPRPVLIISEVETYQLAEKKAASGTAVWAGNTTLLKLTTSNGLVGYGEADTTLRVKPVVETLKEVARVYKGKDPLNFESNMDEWHKHDFYMPVSFESTSAVSAFDMACWDIAGKSFGAPIYELRGGVTRDKIRVYANGWYDGCVGPAQYARRARKCVDAGYTGLKFDPFGPYYHWIDRKGIDAAEGRVKAIRETVGQDVDLLIEHHGRFNPNSAIMIAERLGKYDPLFMEEPIHPDNIEGMKKYRRTGVRVAVGERVITKEQALYLMANDLIDFIQPDIGNLGGITQASKVTGMAETFGIEVAFHNALGPILNAACIQCDVSIPNFLIQESFSDWFPPWKRLIFKDEYAVRRGYVAPGRKHGLGVEVNEGRLDEYASDAMEYFNPEEPVWVVKDTWR